MLEGQKGLNSLDPPGRRAISEDSLFRTIRYSFGSLGDIRRLRVSDRLLDFGKSALHCRVQSSFDEISSRVRNSFFTQQKLKFEEFQSIFLFLFYAYYIERWFGSSH